jgi:carbon storage regulator CsrA
MPGLCISRRLGESFHMKSMLGTALVRILHINKGYVELQIEAPDDVQIFRTEIIERHFLEKESQNKEVKTHATKPAYRTACRRSCHR